MSFKTKFNISNKYIKIDKANQVVVIAVSATVAVVIFCFVATQALVKQIKYQNDVISKRKAANTILEKNIKAAKSLASSFEAFNNAEPKINTLDKNYKIVLNALPSKYDFPALVTTMQNFYKMTGVSTNGFSGTDEEATAVQSSDNPTPIEIKSPTSAIGDLASIQKFIDYLNRSTKPIKINTVSISGSDKILKISLDATTYYQPEKLYEVKYEVVKQSTKSTKKSDSKSTSSSSSSTGATK